MSFQRPPKITPETIESGETEVLSTFQAGANREFLFCRTGFKGTVVAIVPVERDRDGRITRQFGVTLIYDDKFNAFDAAWIEARRLAEGGAA